MARPLLPGKAQKTLREYVKQKRGAKQRAERPHEATHVVPEPLPVDFAKSLLVFVRHGARAYAQLCRNLGNSVPFRVPPLPGWGGSGLEE